MDGFNRDGRAKKGRKSASCELGPTIVEEFELIRHIRPILQMISFWESPAALSPLGNAHHQQQHPPPINHCPTRRAATTPLPSGRASPHNATGASKSRVLRQKGVRDDDAVFFGGW